MASVNTAGIAALFKNPDDGERALDELKRAGYSQALISETESTAAKETRGPTVSTTTVGTPASQASAARTTSPSTRATSSDEDDVGTQEFVEQLERLGVGKRDAHRYLKGVEHGGVVVSVPAAATDTTVTGILKRYGGDVGTTATGGAERASATAAGATVATATASGRGTADETASPEEMREVQLLAERLRVNKLRVRSGEARIGKRVVEEQRSIDVPVAHDELVIERRPVTDGRPAGGPIGESERDIRVPLMREQVEVEKYAVVSEEVEVGTRPVTETQHVAETVRHEELDIDDAATKRAR